MYSAFELYQAIANLYKTFYSNIRYLAQVRSSMTRVTVNNITDHVIKLSLCIFQQF